MAQGDSSSRDLDRRTRELSRKDIQAGSGMAESQMAQNQLQAILNERRNNIAMARVQENQTQSQNQMLAQAGEIMAASSAQQDMGATEQQAVTFNSQTQALLNKYGAGQPKVQRTSGRQVRVTPNNITITNNYKTETTNNVNAGAGGPIQGRPIMMRPASTPKEKVDSGTGRFKAWLSGVFENQKQESIRRERDFDKREWSLTKSANKMMRRIELAGKDIISNMNPKTIGTTIASQFQTLLFVFGATFLAKHWTKVLDIFVKVSNYIKHFLDYVGVTEDGKRLSRSGEGFRGSLISFFGGNPKRGDTLFTVFKRLGTEIMDYLKKKFDDSMEERGAAIKAIKFPKIDLSDMAGALSGITGYLADILTAMIDPEKGLQSQLAHNIQTSGKTSSFQAMQRDGDFEHQTIAKNTDMGDYAVAGTVNGKRKYSLMSNALTGSGDLKDEAAAEVSQGRDILGAINDAKYSGKIDTARLVTGLSRMQENARSTGGVLVDKEFVHKMYASDTKKLISQGQIQPVRMKYVLVPKSQADLDDEGAWGVIGGGMRGYAKQKVGQKIGEYTDPISGQYLARGLVYGKHDSPNQVEKVALSMFDAIPYLGTALNVASGSIYGGIKKAYANGYKLKLVRADDPEYKNFKTYKEDILYNLTPNAISALANRLTGQSKFEAGSLKQVDRLTHILNYNAGGEAAAKLKFAKSQFAGTAQQDIDLSNTRRDFENLKDLQKLHKDEEQAMLPTWQKFGNNALQLGQNVIDGFNNGTSWVSRKFFDATDARNATFAYDGTLGRVDERKSRGGWNLSRALNTLRKNSHETSHHRCSEYVQTAINAGFGHTGSLYLGDAHNLAGRLGEYGFAPLSWEGYQPKAGDVYVCPSIPGHPVGHTAMFDGQIWISDYRQHDMWGGGGMRHFKKGVVFRHVSQLADGDFNPSVYQIENGTEQSGGYISFDSGNYSSGGGTFSSGYYDGADRYSYSGSVSVGGNGTALKGDRSKFFKEHSAAWYNVLKRRGYSDKDARKFSGWFTAQDGFESAAGTSKAAREKNNFGGMQGKGKNLAYGSKEEYMNAKLDMMETKFRSSMRNSNNFGEFILSLGGTSLNHNGYLYYTDNPTKYTNGAYSYFKGQDEGPVRTISYSGFNPRDAYNSEGYDDDSGIPGGPHLDFDLGVNKNMERELRFKNIVAEAARTYEKYPDLKESFGGYDRFKKYWVSKSQKQRQKLLNGLFVYAKHRDAIKADEVFSNTSAIYFAENWGNLFKWSDIHKWENNNTYNRRAHFRDTFTGSRRNQKWMYDSSDKKNWSNELEGTKKDRFKKVYDKIFSGEDFEGATDSLRAGVLFGNDYISMSRRAEYLDDRLQDSRSFVNNPDSYRKLYNERKKLQSKMKLYENAAAKYTQEAKGKGKNQRKSIYTKYRKSIELNNTIQDIITKKQRLQDKYNDILRNATDLTPEKRVQLAQEYESEWSNLDNDQQKIQKLLSQVLEESSEGEKQIIEQSIKHNNLINASADTLKNKFGEYFKSTGSYLDAIDRMIDEYTDEVLTRLGKEWGIPGLQREDFNTNRDFEKEAKEQVKAVEKAPLIAKPVEDIADSETRQQALKNKGIIKTTGHKGAQKVLLNNQRDKYFKQKGSYPFPFFDPKRGGHVDDKGNSYDSYGNRVIPFPFKPKKSKWTGGYVDGYSFGGFTPDGNILQEAGIVHAGEWVAPQKMVKSKKYGPIIRELERARVVDLGNMVARKDNVEGEKLAKTSKDNIVIDPLNAEGQKAMINLLNKIAQNTSIHVSAPNPSPKQMIKRTI